MTATAQLWQVTETQGWLVVRNVLEDGVSLLWHKSNAPRLYFQAISRWYRLAVWPRVLTGSVFAAEFLLGSNCLPRQSAVTMAKSLRRSWIAAMSTNGRGEAAD